MQKLTLLLGHPMYSIAILLAGILLWAAIGSGASGRSRLSLTTLLRLATAGLVTGMLVLGIGVHFASAALLGMPLVVRGICSLLLVGPAFCALGCFFPTGLRLAAERSPEFIPWAWGINSGFSVIGSVAAIVLAMALGFNAVLVIATCIYGVALWSILRFMRA